MSRSMRIEYAGVLYRVTSRDDRREYLFHDEDSRQILLEAYSEVCS